MKKTRWTPDNERPTVPQTAREFSANERFIALIITVLSAPIGLVSEYYLQKGSEQAFIHVCRFFYALCHNPEVSYIATALLQNHGGDMMLPIFAFGSVLFLEQNVSPENTQKNDGNPALVRAAIIASMIAVILTLGELSTLGYQPNTAAHKNSGFDALDILSISIIPITTILYMLLKYFQEPTDSAS